MRKIIFTQVLTDNGKSVFHGLFDKNGLPVAIELEKDDDGTAMTAVRRELSEFEKQQFCCQFDNCDICPLYEDCKDEYLGDEEDFCDENTCC